MLEVTAEDADRLERKRKKKNPDQGFSGIAYILVLLYSSLIKNLSLIILSAIL